MVAEYLMESTNSQLVERIKQRFQEYKDRNTDAYRRYIANVPAQQARDRNTDEMLLERMRVQQPTKPKTSKQYDTARRMSSQSSDQGSNNPNLNGVFNNNDIVQTSQKRPYMNYSGNTNNGTQDVPLQKMSRMSTDSNKQYNNIQNYNVPNVNPFQQPNDGSKAVSSPVVNTHVSPNNMTNSSVNLSNKMLGNMQSNIGSRSNVMQENIKDKNLIASNVKTEVSQVGTCNVTPVSSSSNVAQINRDGNQNSNFNQYNNSDSLTEFDNFKLYGETTSKNNTSSNSSKSKIEVKLEQQPSDSEMKIKTLNTSQMGQQNWRPLTDQNMNNVSSNAVQNLSKSTNPLENLNRMVAPGLQNQNQIDPVQRQQQAQQMNSNRTVNLNTMISSTINLQGTNNISSTKSMSLNNSVGSPHAMMQSPKNSLQSPLNNLQQKTMNALSPSMPSSNMSQLKSMNVLSPSIPSNNMSQMQGNMPPNLPRGPTTPNMRQYLADHINKHQLPMPNMPNMSTMNNPLMNNPTGPTTNEKLQEHLLKKREQQSRIMQSQMVKNQFMSSQHLMSPINNPMSQMNPFQFPNDYQSYNQQSIGMQPQQNSISGFYSNPYQMEQIQSGQMFPNTAPPGYNQQNRAAGMLRTLIRDRQQMSDMYNSSMGNMRPTIEQQAMYNTKAPPQYSAQGMGSLEQQMMMSGNTNMQSASRLSHFSQPNNTMSMANPPNMNPSQVRMRAPMSAMNRYPAPPSLSRSMTMSGNESSQYSNFNMAQQNMMSMNQNNPNFSANYTNEQLMFLQKKRLVQRQQQLLLQQRQNQSSMMQPANYNLMMNNPAGGMMQDNPSRMGMNMNTGTSLFPQQQQQQQQIQPSSTMMQQTNMMQQSNDLASQSNNIIQQPNMSHQSQMNQPNSMSHQPNNMIHQSNPMGQQSNTMMQQSTSMMSQQQQQPNPMLQPQQTTLLQDPSNKQVPGTINLSADKTNLNTVDSNKNLLTAPNQNQLDSTRISTHLGNVTQSSIDQETADETDLDSLLSNPPEHFDLVKMFN